MALVYEECGNCRRKGAYVVVDRDVVRCKYCTASEECKRLHPSNLGAVAAGLHAVDDDPRGAGRGSSRKAEPPESGTGIPGGVMSMDMATISVLSGGATRHRSSYPPARPALVPLPRAKSPDLTAIVVDDDPLVRALVVATLERGGINVTQAGSGEEGCTAILADPPDVAVVDLGMPGMDGLEVLVELRRRCDTGIKIVVVSGRSSEGDRVVARELGADDYVAKPFVPADLLSRVEAVIAGRTPRPAASSTG